MATMSLGTGVVVPPWTADPAGDTRRLEDLGLDHAALPGATTTQVLLALGATRSLHLVVADPRELVDAVACLAPGFRDRLHAWPTTRHVVPLRLTDVPHEPGTVRERHGWAETPLIKATCAEAAVQIAELGDDPGDITVQLLGTPHARLARAFALDVLATDPATRGGWFRYAEDLSAGDGFDLGEFTVSEDDIIAFGERWDPLDFHTDPLLARSSPLGVLCASGMHTQAILHRLAARGLHRKVAVVAGRRMLGMRLWSPVTAEMRLRGHTEVVSVEPRPNGRALVVVRSTLTSDDTLILEQTGELVVQQRPG